MKVQKTGDWVEARKLLTAAPLRLKAAVDVALRQEAQTLRKEIVQGITKQAAGGKSFQPLSPLTLAARRFGNFKGTKALLVRADLRNAISAIVKRGEAFVGVPRKARGQDGQPTIDIARLNEFGSDPIVIPITPKMRRFLFALYREAGVKRAGGSGKGVVVVRVPPRPFLRPAFNRFKKSAQHRFLNRVSRSLGFGHG